MEHPTMSTGGRILDVYDDRGGDVFRRIYPTAADVPETVKTAAPILEDDRARLPDHVFALVTRADDGTVLRKFACVDPGGTELAVEYFIKTAAALTPTAAAVVASNLIHACGWYGLDGPAEKLAGLLGSAINAGMTGLQIAGIGNDVRARLGTVAAAAPGTILSPSQISKGVAGGMGKVAADRTSLGIARLSPVRDGTPERNESTPTALNRPPSPPRGMSPHVVNAFLATSPTELRSAADSIVQEKKASIRTALPGRYPLDGLDQVRTAIEYFEKHASEFDRYDRVAYAKAVTARAAELGIEPTVGLVKCASDLMADPLERELAIRSRAAHLVDFSQIDVLRDGVKTAAERGDLTALEAVFSTFDRAVGLDAHWGGSVPDPVWSARSAHAAGEKTAAAVPSYVPTGLTDADLHRIVRGTGT